MIINKIKMPKNSFYCFLYKFFAQKLKILQKTNKIVIIIMGIENFYSLLYKCDS